MNTDKTTIDLSNESLHDAMKGESSDYSDSMKIHIECSFEAGANWQKEKDKAVIDKLIEALRECRNELYRMKMAEALLWAAHADKAQEFASEQTEKYTQLLNTIQKENELK